jgi:hypothetical protein
MKVMTLGLVKNQMQTHTELGPVKTVERARDIAESTSYANEQIKIIIREGVYSFATPP